MTTLIPVEDFVAPPERTRATLSPDGTRIAFLAPWKERLNIWVAGVDDLDGARCVTADDVRSIHDYSWADDRFLVYAQDDGGDEQEDLHGPASLPAAVPPLASTWWNHPRPTPRPSSRRSRRRSSGSSSARTACSSASW